MFGRHTNHVHANDAHDGNLEFLICDDLEKQKLELGLQHVPFIIHTTHKRAHISQSSSTVQYSQGVYFCLRYDLDCVEWGVKLYSLTHLYRL